jgi:hypothetical protein
METLERWRLGERRTFEIYEQEEAEELGIKYAHWKKVKEGDWALTDDGFVMQCLKRREFSGGDEIVLSGARAWEKQKQILWIGRRETRSWSEPTEGTWGEHMAHSRRGKAIAHAAATMLLNTGRFDYEKLAQMYRPDHSFPVSSLKRLLKQPEIREMIRKEVETALSKEGVTNEYVIALGKEVVNSARNSENVAEMGRMFERWVKLLGLNDNTQTREISPHGSGVLDAVSEDIKQIEKDGERTKT